MAYRISHDRLGHSEPPSIVVVGCGGTGAFVAEGLCRLLGEARVTLALVDHDRVEEHNLRRQAFYQRDLGRFKAEVVAERLSRDFGREIAYSVYPYGPEVHHEFFRGLHSGEGIIVGCVDNAAARSSIAQVIQRQWWLDAGNGEHSGQVLIGNTVRAEDLKGSFIEEEEICRALPTPSLQQPALLVPAPEPVPPPDCAEAVAAGDQSPTINQAMAALTLEFLSRFLVGKLTWMAAYLDLEAGSLRPVLIEPKTVARLTGLGVDEVMAKPRKPDGRGEPPPCPRCGQRHW